MMHAHRTSRLISALVVAGATMLAISTAQAAMAPATASDFATPDVQTVGCLLGAHVGPVGACIGGHHHHHHCWINRWGHRVCD